MPRRHNELMLLYQLGQTLENEANKLKRSPGGADVKRLAKRCENWQKMLESIASFEEGDESEKKTV